MDCSNKKAADSLGVKGTKEGHRKLKDVVRFGNDLVPCDAVRYKTRK